MAYSRLLSVEDLLVIVKDRGLSLAWSGGRLILKGDKAKAPEPLLKLLAYHREELEKRFPPPPAENELWCFEHCGKRWFSEKQVTPCVGCLEDVVSTGRKAMSWKSA